MKAREKRRNSALYRKQMVKKGLLYENMAGFFIEKNYTKNNEILYKTE